MRINYGTTPKLTDADKTMFSRGNYECKLLLKDRKGKPVVISQSKDHKCPIWKVESAFSCVVFGSYEDALDYCRGRFGEFDGEEM